MRKILSALVAVAMVLTLSLQSQVHAAQPISIYIDGVKLSTDQAPVSVGGRVLLPMRAIFEALNAYVDWEPKSKTVTAVKDGTTVQLRMGSKTATINNATVSLDVPAQAIKGRTMVPVRFVSEALGETVDWNSSAKTVYITTSGDVGAAYNVNARIVGEKGDGRDLEASFTKASSDAYVDHYRVMVVKADRVSNFTLAKAQSVSSRDYTVVKGQGINQTVSFNSQTRDTDGDLLRADRDYAVFVLSVGKASNKYALSHPSRTVTISGDSAVKAATDIKVSDVNDYGDGRDLRVSFTKPGNDANIANYRIMVVKTKDASEFTLAKANAVPSSYSTVVNRTGSSTTTLSSSSRDVSGDLIRNGVPYTVFVLSVSSQPNSAPSKLSSGSSSITLNSSMAVPVITKVEDVSNYGDGRDLQISFTKSSEEWKVGYYRIFAVKLKDASNFNLEAANKVSYGRYYDVSKTGNNISVTLPSYANDVDGHSIRNGETYRLFVMAVSSDSKSYDNVLSAPSQAIALSNSAVVGTATNVTVNDVSNYNDGRDMKVEFYRASDESVIHHYRVMVVKTADAHRFNLSAANNVSSSNYTSVNKTGRDLSLTLSSSARDVDGSLIRNGTSYTVFVLSVGNNYNGNALSSPSASITLSNSSTVYPVNYVSASDVSDYNDGRDLLVTFNKAADESSISHYRIMVVKSANAGRFNLSAANNVSSANYTLVNKTGWNISQTLSSGARDVDGSAIKNGVSYRIFVLSVGTGNNGNALSSPSTDITLTSNYAVPAVTGLNAYAIPNYGDGRDIEVSFVKASHEANVAEYRIMVVPSDQSGGFRLGEANAVGSANYTKVAKQGRDISLRLSDSTRDVNGNGLARGVKYKVFVLTVADARSGSANALSAPSVDVQLTDLAVPAVTNVTAIADGTNMQVSFTKASNESSIAYYAVMVVPSGSAGSFNLAEANRIGSYGYKSVGTGNSSVTLTTSDTDITGASLRTGVSYHVFVLSIADGRIATVNALSGASGEVVLQEPPVPANNGVTPQDQVTPEI
ncbi:hypothetical protein PAE9249_03797 [Paenibacillus sp. CECT 9249]|uniref:copper amine oxidase N-terminal domain-containing protein n=1 Tax=Paenibacillus sp. CECT 9249 TaxID=2845385 RepID=UPI001E4477A9|nr:copper amine oxidase N-terminal domain-containing protein [Paenibacillus sp. CECT 9249]CAH0121270.1 hypothetical protein PAE9249_03797 [Paenibacillus sp. CECT 9249]